MVANRRNPIKDRFINWLIDYPTKEARRVAGVPVTMGEWASANDVARETCQRWKSEPDCQEAVTAGFRQEFCSNDDVAEIMATMVRQAKEGNNSSAKLILDAMGITGRKSVSVESEKPVDTSKLAGLSKAALLELANSVEE